MQGSGLKSRAEILEDALAQVQKISQETSEYLSMFPGTGLCVHSLSKILNVVEPLLESGTAPTPKSSGLATTQLTLFNHDIT